MIFTNEVHVSQLILACTSSVLAGSGAHADAASGSGNRCSCSACMRTASFNSARSRAWGTSTQWLRRKYPTSPSTPPIVSFSGIAKLCGKSPSANEM